VRCSSVHKGQPEVVYEGTASQIAAESLVSHANGSVDVLHGQVQRLPADPFIARNSIDQCRRNHLLVVASLPLRGHTEHAAGNHPAFVWRVSRSSCSEPSSLGCSPGPDGGACTTCERNRPPLNNTPDKELSSEEQIGPV